MNWALLTFDVTTNPAPLQLPSIVPTGSGGSHLTPVVVSSDVWSSGPRRSGHGRTTTPTRNTRRTRAHTSQQFSSQPRPVSVCSSAPTTHGSFSLFFSSSPAAAGVFVFLSFLPRHSLRSAPVSRSTRLAPRGGIPALKRPVSRPPSADADHLEGIYPGAVFLLASSRGAARRPESLRSPAVFGLISLFVVARGTWFIFC